MNTYEQRLEEDVDRIRERIVAVAGMVDKALKNAVQSLLTGDLDQGYGVVLGDHAINRDVRQTDRLCHHFVVRHLPSAGHLRMVSSVLRIDRELERIGDYAATIGRETGQLREPPPRPVARNIEMLADQARRMLRQAIQAFEEQNADLARGTMTIERQIDTMFDKLIVDLMEQGGDHSLKELFGWLVVLNRLERVSDRARNICDEVVFWTTGEGKSPKIFGILFLDERNGCVSQMAEAIARKAYPKLGRYHSAGLDPADSLNEHVVPYMESMGCSFAGHKPKQLDTSLAALADLHVVVGIGVDPAEHIPETPFQTAMLAWEPLPCPVSQEQAADVYRQLVHQIRDLMETLHGDEAF